MTIIKLYSESNKYLEGDLLAHSDELGWKVRKIENENGFFEFEVELPTGWTIQEISKSIRRAVDSQGNPRAAFYMDCGVQYYTRFELRQTKAYNPATGGFGERLSFYDKKRDKEVIDFGFTDSSIELYSEDHRDLLSIARASVPKGYSNWESPAYYWDED